MGLDRSWAWTRLRAWTGIECEERSNPGGLDFLTATFSPHVMLCILPMGTAFCAPGGFDRARDQQPGRTPYINNFIVLPGGASAA